MVRSIIPCFGSVKISIFKWPTSNDTSHFNECILILILAQNLGGIINYEVSPFCVILRERERTGEAINNSLNTVLHCNHYTHHHALHSLHSLVTALLLYNNININIKIFYIHGHSQSWNIKERLTIIIPQTCFPSWFLIEVWSVWGLIWVNCVTGCRVVDHCRL